MTQQGTSNPGTVVGGRRAWRSSELGGAEDWITHLDCAAVDAVAAAAARLPDDPSTWADSGMDAIVDPDVAQVLASATNDLWDGRGFFWLRGLPVDDPVLLRRLFWVVGNNVGEPTMQNARGEVLSEVFDRYAGAERGVDTRGYESNDELRFHCDGGDSIGLACVRQAPTGGDNGLVSLTAIHDEIVTHHAEHLPIFERGFALYSRKEQSESGTAGGAVQQRRIPMFGWGDDGLSCWSNMRLAELASQVSGVRFTSEEAAALAIFEEIAERPDFKLTARSQPGDVIWINNMAVMHRRDRYEDSADPAERRRLYRMWVNSRAPRHVIAEHRSLRAGIRGPRATIGSVN